MNSWQMAGGTVKSKGRGFIIDQKDKIHHTIHSTSPSGSGKFGDERDNPNYRGHRSTMPRRVR